MCVCVCVCQESSARGESDRAGEGGAKTQGGSQVHIWSVGTFHDISQSCSRVTQDQYVCLKKERDYHRMQHRRVLQEKAGLATEAGRLRKHFASHEPLLQTLRKKYQVSPHSFLCLLQ